MLDEVVVEAQHCTSFGPGQYPLAIPSSVKPSCATDKLSLPQKASARARAEVSPCSTIVHAKARAVLAVLTDAAFHIRYVYSANSVSLGATSRFRLLWMQRTERTAIVNMETSAKAVTDLDI